VRKRKKIFSEGEGRKETAGGDAHCHRWSLLVSAGIVEERSMGKKKKRAGRWVAIAVTFLRPISCSLYFQETIPSKAGRREKKIFKREEKEKRKGGKTASSDERCKSRAIGQFPATSAATAGGDHGGKDQLKDWKEKKKGGKKNKEPARHVLCRRGVRGPAA